MFIGVLAEAPLPCFPPAYCGDSPQIPPHSPQFPPQFFRLIFRTRIAPEFPTARRLIARDRIPPALVNESQGAALVRRAGRLCTDADWLPVGWSRRLVTQGMAPDRSVRPITRRGAGGTFTGISALTFRTSSGYFRDSRIPFHGPRKPLCKITRGFRIFRRFRQSFMLSACAALWSTLGGSWDGDFVRASNSDHSGSTSPSPA